MSQPSTGAELSELTSRSMCPVNAYPNRCSVRITRGARPSSPSASLASATTPVSVASDTWVSGHSFDINSVLETALGARPSRRSRNSSVFGAT
jgi:hypothetical protein